MVLLLPVPSSVSNSRGWAPSGCHPDAPRRRRGALLIGGHAILVDALLLLRALLLVLVLLPWRILENLGVTWETWQTRVKNASNGDSRGQEKPCWEWKIRGIKNDQG